MKKYNDFNTDGERLEYIKGILECTQKIIRGTWNDKEQGYISHDTAVNMIETEKVCTYNFIEDFFEED